MNIEAVLFASTYILIAIIELFVGVALIIGQDNKRIRNILAGFLFLISLSNFMIPLFQGDITAFGQFWLSVRMILLLMNAFFFPLFFIASLRPAWITKWVFRIFVILIALPVIFFTLDITGLSETFFNQVLISTLPDVNITTDELLGAIGLANGPLGIFYGDIAQINVFIIILFSFGIGFIDRKENRINSRAALVLGTTLLIGAALILQQNFEVTDWSFTVVFTLLQIVLAFGIGFISLSNRHETLTFENLQHFLGNWPMFNKLMLAVMIVVIPGILLLSFTSVIFLQSNFTELVGEDLQTLAEVQQNIFQSQIAKEIQALYNLSNEQLSTALISSRLSTYQGRTEEDIFQQLRQAELTWQRQEENNPFVIGLLSSTRNSYMQDFIQLTPLHSGIVLADIHGGLVTATDREVTFDQSRELWWQQVTNTKHPYIGLNEDNEGFLYIEIAVPVQADGNPFDIEGVLMSRYSITEIVSEVYDLSVGDKGGLALYSQNRVWIHPYSTHHIGSNSTNIVDPELDWRFLTNNPSQFWQITEYNSTENMVAWARFDQDLAATGNLNWVMIAYKPVDEALEPIINMRWIALVIGSVLLIGSVFLTSILARLIVQPLLDLTDTAEKIIRGERKLKANVGGTDEIGLLATSFNQVTDELNKVVNSLEDTIQERTDALEKRALQLETSALVAQEAASIRNLEVLLTSVSDLITERFGFYHAGIFLVDQSKEYAVLRAANSPGGKRMLDRGHKLQIGKVGVVGFAAGVGEPRMAQDVGADVVYYDNPDMPDTQSELALPLKVRNEVIGVLDVQSTRANAFSREDVVILEILADQIALAIDNTRLLESSQRALTELQYLYGQRAGEAWKNRLESKPIELHYDPSGFSTKQNQIMRKDSLKKTLIQNITFRGQIIGAIELEREEAANEDWTLEEQTLVAEIIEQAALALENARLVDQIRFRSDQIQLLQEVTALSAGLLNEQDLLNQVATKLQQDMDLQHINILTIDPVQQIGQVATNVSHKNAPSIKYLMKDELNLKDNEVILEVIQTRQPVVIYDLESDKRTNGIKYYENFHNAQTLVLVPLIARGDVIGLIEFSVVDTERRFEIDELTLLDQIGTQVATALDSTRLFSQTAQRAARERLVADITNKVRASNDPETIIQTAVQELQQALGAKHAQIVMGNGNPKEEAQTNGTNNGHTEDTDTELTTEIQEKTNE